MMSVSFLLSWPEFSSDTTEVLLIFHVRIMVKFRTTGDHSKNSPDGDREFEKRRTDVYIDSW